MKKIIMALVACSLFVSGALASIGFESEAMHLVYSETSKVSKTTKEYFVRPVDGGGYDITLHNQSIQREITCGPDLNTLSETYFNSETGDRLKVERQGEALHLTGTLGGKAVDREFEAKGLWYGTVLLLRDFVLSGDKEVLFYVTKPETEEVVLLKAIRQEEETVDVGGLKVPAVRIKYTVPGFKGMFWKSYYWYRLSDGMLVTTEEVRGGPGTPTVYAELLQEVALNESPAEDASN